MKKPLSSFLILTGLCLASQTVNAYGTINYNITTVIPKLTSLSTVLASQKGSSSVDLNFQYNPKTAGFSCINSSLDGIAVSCTGSQKNQTYSITVKQKKPSVTITLKGVASATTATATYSGPKGKLANKNPSVNLASTSNPVSGLTLNPLAIKKGKLTGTALLNSAYLGSEGSKALSGTIKTNAKKITTVTWSFKYAHDKLSFTGTETNNTWLGKLTGQIGPAAISLKNIAIPLTSTNSGASTFKGNVTSAPTTSSFGGSTPLSAVKVSISTDLNNNGSIDSDETATTSTDSTGNYSTSSNTQSGTPVTITFDKDGYTQTPKRYESIQPGSEIVVNTALQELPKLTLNGNDAVSADNKLKIDNLPSNITDIKGQVFNPVTETAQFPGEFADNTGNRLVSAVFANIKAKDSQGNPVTQLSNSTELRMLVPSDTWDTMKDLSPGNGQIDIPLYYYDEADGQWKRSTSDGWLEDENRGKLAESQLAAIKAKTYTGSLYGVGQISHLSYWNIDWPVSTHGCVTGKILDASGNPVSGATVIAKGISYNGTSSPQTTNSDGSFCIEVMRSEGVNEDINENGIPGEKTSISLTVSYAGKYYQLLGPFDIPSIQAQCGGNGCLDLGGVRLTPDIEQTLSLCTIKGQAVFSGKDISGQASNVLPVDSPMAGAYIYGYDPDVGYDAWTQCYTSNTSTCSLFTTADSEGNFTLTFPFLTGGQLLGFQFTADLYYSLASLSTCPDPSTVYKLKLDSYNLNLDQ